MSEFLIQDTTLEDIADAIRAKKGTSEGIQVSNFPSEIASIPTGSNGAIVHPTIYDTNTGTYQSPFNAYFNIGNNTYAIGFKYDAGVTQLRLFRVSNGSITDIGKLCNVTSLASLNSIRNTLQYKVVRTIYNNVEHVYLVFTFIDDQITSGHQKLYCLDYTGSSSSLLVSSIDLPVDTRHLLATGDGRRNGRSSIISLYDPNSDSIWLCLIDENGLGTWSLITGDVFGSTPSVTDYSMATCSHQGNQISIYRSDISQIYRFSITPGSISGGTHYTAQSQYQSKKFFALYPFGTGSANSRKIFGFRKVISAGSDDTHIDVYMNEITLNTDRTLSYGYDIVTSFIPSNGNLFLKTHNDYRSPVCLNGYGCVGYFENTDAITDNMSLL